MSRGGLQLDSRGELLDALLPVLDLPEGVPRVVDTIQDGAVEVPVARGDHRVENLITWVEAVHERDGEALDLGAKVEDQGLDQLTLV